MMFWAEWNKMMRYRYGIVIVCVYFLIHIIILWKFTVPYQGTIEQYRSSYDDYMQILEGKLTDEKETFIKEENEYLRKTQMQLTDLKWDYLYGRIDQETYEKQMQQFNDLEEKNAAFNVIYQQYIHVREDVEKRYFLYTNGWDGLLSNEKVDYFLLFAMLLLIIPIFCEEERNSMAELLSCQKKCANHFSCYQTAVAMGIVVLMVLGNEVLKYSYYQIYYGLPHGNYGLQSLYYYKDTKKIISLQQAFFLVVFYRVIGSISMTSILLLCSSIAKKYTAAFPLGFCVTILPFLFVDNLQSFVKWPLPFSYIIGTIHLLPDYFETSIYTGEKKLLYPEMTWSQEIIFSCILLGTTFFCVYFLWIFTKNYWLKPQKKKTTAQLFCLFLLGSSCILNGCHKQPTHSYEAFCNTSYKDYETEQFCFYFKGGILQYENKDTGEVGEALRDVQREYYSLPQTAIFGWNNQLYYIRMTYTYEDNIKESPLDLFSIYALDTQNFEETLIYEQRLNLDNNFLGLNWVALEDTIVFVLNGHFFLDAKSLYFINEAEHCIYQVNLTTHQIQVLLDLPAVASNLQIIFDGENIYYQNEYYELVCYCIQTAETNYLNGVTANCFVWAEDGIYYGNMQDNNSLFYYEFASNTSKKIGNVTVSNLWYDGANIYYLDETENQLYEMNLAEETSRLVYSGTVNYVHLFSGLSHFYVEDLNGQWIEIKKEHQ